VNPLSGERIVILSSTAEKLVWELQLAPGGRVPSTHAHPEQHERFTVLDGRMRFRIADRSMMVLAGGKATVPPGTVHSFTNPGPLPARVLVETSPALDMEALLETAAAIARDQRTAARAFPRVFDLVLFMHDFEREVTAPYLPTALVRFVVGAFARLAGMFGADARYRRLRGAAPQ
jgi:mannose-6-phosphate isomerase-like protein (cupin superfamily)